MFETTFCYKNMVEEEMHNIYYNIIGYKLRKRYIVVEIIIMVIAWVNFLDILIRDYLNREKLTNLTLVIVCEIIYLLLLVIVTYILISGWKGFYFFLNKKLFLDRFKDNCSIDISILADEVYIKYHSKKILLLPKYPIILKEKMPHNCFRIFVYDTQKYIFFTITNTCYFIYIDKEQLPEDKIIEIQSNLKKIYGRCYVQKK